MTKKRLIGHLSLVSFVLGTVMVQGAPGPRGALDAPAATPGPTRPIIGAIRWDAWHTPWSRFQPGAPDGPVRAMELSLGPKQFHYRAPFFARVVSDNEVQIGGYTPAIMDREIAYASSGGLDYWAFLLYEPDTSMSQGLSLYLASPRKRDIHFCAMAQGSTFGEAAAFPVKMMRVVKLIAEPSYQMVMGDRPLLYLFDVPDSRLQAWGGAVNARKLFDSLRAAVKAQGQGDPYLVVMDFNPAHGQKVADAIGAQAISSYVWQGGGKAAPYAQLARGVHGFWDQCAATGKQVVPIAVAGWDRRPRIEHPVPWEKYQKPGVGMEYYYQMPTPQELAAHIRDAMTWTQQGDRSPARAVLIYAWNEHDEGGYLCPTLNPDGTPNSARLDAIGAMVRGWEAAAR